LEKNVREKSFHPLYRSEQDRGDEKARSKFFSEKKYPLYRSEQDRGDEKARSKFFSEKMSGKNHFTLFTDQKGGNLQGFYISRDFWKSDVILAQTQCLVSALRRGNEYERRFYYVSKTDEKAER